MSKSNQEFMAHEKAVQDWLDAYCDGSKGVAGGVVMLTNPQDGTLTVAAQRSAATSNADGLVAAAKASIADGAPIVSHGEDSTARPNRSTQVVSLPVRSGSRTLGAVALELPADAEAMRAALLDLERAAAALASALGSSDTEASQLDAATVLQLQAALLSHDRFAEAATAFATELASTFNVDRVAIGFLEDRHTTVVAVSRSADFHSRAELLRALGEAMDEAIDQSATICFPENDRPRITIAHAHFVRRQGGSLCTIPLISRERAFGAITLERGGNTQLSKQEIGQCENIACMIGPILELRRNDERPWHDRLKRVVQVIRGVLLGAGHARTKALAYGGLAILAALLFVPVEDRVSAPARVEGAIQRSLVAPVDGFLRTAYVKPGDRVT
ncbi:MAG: GAF domain-containing protein, partial [Burkholderiales bacterium]